jgi:hypothetical protein
MNEIPLSQPEPERKGSFTQSEEFQPVIKSLQECAPDKMLDSIANPREREFFYQMFSATGDLPLRQDDKRPQWALTAWKEFIRSIAIVPNEGNEVHVLGRLSGLVSEVGD